MTSCLVDLDEVIDNADACRHCAYIQPPIPLHALLLTLSVLPYGPHNKVILTTAQVHEVQHHGIQPCSIKNSESVGATTRCFNGSETEGPEWSVSHLF